MAQSMMITGGPSKYDIMLDFFDGNNRESAGHEFKFHRPSGGAESTDKGLQIFLAHTRKIGVMHLNKIMLNSLKKMDRECENFDFTGWAWAGHKTRVFVEGKYCIEKRLGSFHITKTLNEDGCVIE